jgi:site-specific recombinase XerD
MSKKSLFSNMFEKPSVDKSKILDLKNSYEKSKKRKKYQDYFDASQADATRRAYASDLRHFFTQGGSIPCTPKRLIKYLVKLANEGFAVATLERRITSIHRAHSDQGYPSPACSQKVKKIMQGIRRILGSQQRQVHPLMKEDLVAALESAKDDQMLIKVVRDRALLLVGFASAMRRAELVSVCVEHLNFFPEGLEIKIPESKTDQERRGRTVFIPMACGAYCPIEALKNWLELSGVKEGHVFRAVSRYGHVAKNGLSAQSVAIILKKVMSQTGLDIKEISGHSLRAGYCTTAAELGFQTWQIREQTGHKSDATLLNYIRRTSKRNVPSVL